MAEKITLIECPRDAMQGWKKHIPTTEKVAYLNSLLSVGFEVLDFGSFVSPKTIPQMADTKEVIPQLTMNDKTKLLAIIANTRGAEDAVVYDKIHYLGFPFSISETFQQRNTIKSIKESLKQVEEIQGLCVKNNKELVIYISMGFGNPYGDPYNAEIAINWVNQLAQLDIKTFSMADTVGLAKPEGIQYIFENLIKAFPTLAIGAHFHSTPTTWEEKIQAAYDNGCLRFDSAIKGIGGCPMAKDELVGNIATENLIAWCDKHHIPHGLDMEAFYKSFQMAANIFI